ncbi:hypothetical protein [Streptomyces sp. NBC_00102]|uniref:hypothetical protein n=1 Tax=Streptomyces sp. NBC_00102 TaxID=2975652 RepID=UPI002254E29F|nr:hypothetical protein [Streptomyces sp. NBC_00102]MCX5398722.1 hypothetical protein [Streptomyces sp. NBC_00102]
MPFEDDLSGELRRTGDSFELSDRTALLDGAVAIGRRGVRRRRIATATGGALALALVALGGGLATGLVGGAGPTTDLASGTHSVSPGAGGESGVSGSEMVETLAALLPGGKVSEGSGIGTGELEDGAAASASVLYDDGDGPVTVTASLYPTPQYVRARGTEGACADEPGALRDMPEGVALTHDTVGGPALTAGSGGKASAAECPTPVDAAAPQEELVGYRFRGLAVGGVTVDVRAYSGVLDAGAVGVRSTPPLDQGQLAALGQSAKWAPLVQRMKVVVAAQEKRHEASPTASPAPELDYSTLMPTLLKLLPKDVTVVRQEQQDGGEYAEVVVDDGQGQSLLGINVQRDMRDVAGDLYGGAETLPDGTLLAVTQAPGEKGGDGIVQWTADSMRPDGMRVVVMAFNGPRQDGAATRSEPALSIDELKALVTSPKWLKLQVK